MQIFNSNLTDRRISKAKFDVLKTEFNEEKYYNNALVKIVSQKEHFYSDLIMKNREQGHMIQTQ
jgi:hypothetical protein